MNRIRLLPEQVANQIAAGEVVERPASVVKELVENSLDARPTRITVEIQAGGRSLIRVTDDGLGMGKDDALLCLERHATSKIQRAEDLAAIATMGFRGEALPSIASVSRFVLTTRERADDGGADAVEGTQIVVNGGKIVEVKAAGCAVGTSVEVRQVFFNLPARRKFLRSEETEAAHVQHYLTLAALGHPEVGFTFLKDGRPVWQLPPLKSGDKLAGVGERLRALLGNGLKLLPVDFTGQLPVSAALLEDEPGVVAETASDPQFRVWGFIGAPGVARSTREDQHLFVNRRPVENRALNYALLEGYHTALMKGRYPVCCLFIEMSPAEVDVNIHPAKREVKFHHERAVQRLVMEAVKATLLAFHSQGGATGEPAPVSAIARPEGNRPVAAPVLELKAPEEAPPAPRTSELPNFPTLTRPLANWPAPAPVPEKNSSEEVSSMAPGASPLPPAPSAPPLPPLTPVPLLHVPLRIVGVVGKLYVVLESDRGLVLLDQHAAHERILFEQMMRRLESKEAADSQRLLLPETLELAPRDAHFLRQNLVVLTRLGVGLSEFGERTFLLDALPPFVKAGQPRQFVLELVDELKATGQTVNTLRLGEHVVAKTVCRHAVKANDILVGKELEKLLEDLGQCTMPYTCPHGRPTLIEMNYRELEKKFGRSQ